LHLRITAPPGPAVASAHHRPALPQDLASTQELLRSLLLRFAFPFHSAASIQLHPMSDPSFQDLASIQELLRSLLPGLVHD